MLLINPSFEILQYPTKESVELVFERAARNCYKSEHRIKQGSAQKLLKYILAHEHTAMIEFLNDIVVKFTSNRGFSQELIRHRIASYAEESTRYVNHSKERYGRKIRVCPIPEDWFKLDNSGDVIRAEEIVCASHLHAEKSYMELVKLGVPVEIAREVLPIGLKTEIFIKTNVVEWRHIFKLRTSKRAHPRMRQLMIPLLLELASLVPIVFDDLAQDFREPEVK